MRGIETLTDPAAGTIAPLALTLAEVAEQLRVTERYVYMLVEREELPSFKSGKRRLIRMIDLMAYIDGLVEEERNLRRSLTSST